MCNQNHRKLSTLKSNIRAIGLPEPRSLWTRLCRRQDPWALKQRFASTSTPRPGRISEIMSESRPTKRDMTQENLLRMLPIPRWGDGSCPEPRQGSRGGGWRRERATGSVLPCPKRQQCPTPPTISPAVKRRWKEFMETGASRQPWQVVVFANAARRDAGFFNVFLLRSYFLWVVWVGGWGDVNVPWKRYVTYAGVGVGGWGDVNVPWKRYVTYAGVGVGGVGWC